MDPVFSDEPDRVRQITSGLFSEQSHNWKASVGNAQAELILGADARDDCAVFRLRGDVDLVAGSDYVRGPKFALYEKGYMSLYDLGYYLAAANLSDVAAMGAVPLGLLTVVRYPADMSDEQFAQVLKGIRDACAEQNVFNVGGDIGTAERLILSASAMGICAPGTSLTRSGAAAGDLVAISGPTGLAAAAMTYFLEKDSRGWALSPEDEDVLLNSWRRPQAQVTLGSVLAQQELANACQDTSDGLKATVEQIAASSDVGIVIDEQAIPVHPAVQKVADLADLDPLTLVFGGSVDFRLLFTSTRRSIETLRNSDLAHKTLVIGEVNDTKQVTLRRTDGSLTALPGVAWRHQAGPTTG